MLAIVKLNALFIRRKCSRVPTFHQAMVFDAAFLRAQTHGYLASWWVEIDRPRNLPDVSRHLYEVKMYGIDGRQFNGQAFVSGKRPDEGYLFGTGNPEVVSGEEPDWLSHPVKTAPTLE